MGEFTDVEEAIIRNLMGDLLYFYMDSVKFTKRDIEEYLEDDDPKYIRECVNRLIEYKLLGYIPFTHRTIYFIPHKVKILVKQWHNVDVCAGELVDFLLSSLNS